MLCSRELCCKDTAWGTRLLSLPRGWWLLPVSHQAHQFWLHLTHRFSLWWRCHFSTETFRGYYMWTQAPQQRHFLPTLFGGEKKKNKKLGKSSKNIVFFLPDRALQKEPRAQALMRARVSSATGSRFGVWGFTALQTKQWRCLFALVTSDSPHLPVIRSLSAKSDWRQWTVPGFRHAAPQAWGRFSLSPCPSKWVGTERHPRTGRVTCKCNAASLL